LGITVRGPVQLTMIEDVVLFVVVIALLPMAVWAVIWPDRVIAFRKRKGWHNRSLLLGGAFYATPTSTRVTGILLTILLLLGLVEALTRFITRFASS
jgi:hypothetical protein